MGPTASGKTDLAIALHERYPVDIISVDSAQIYRGMDIGTAKPDAATLRKAPHALIDIRDPAESYSAAEFREDALSLMHRSAEQGRVPLLVGGTMLYFRALTRGLADLPPADQAVRSRLETEAAAQGWEELHRRLERLDPEIARRIHPNDPQRIQRALEVIELTGRRMSELQDEHTASGPRFRIFRIVACPESRAVLHQRIEQRFDQMLADGFLQEVQRLFDRGDLTPDMPSMRCVGYRQAWACLEGGLTLEEMRQKAIAATRQLAKRQLTWLRQETGALWYDSSLKESQYSVIGEVAEFLEL
jgi:tRNA dimethylallyltransferase